MRMIILGRYNDWGKNNSRIISFFARSGRPYSFSIATAVYRILPMNTDLTPFLEAGFNGINLSILDSMDEYHTDYDNLDSVCVATLQNYGNTLMPLLLHYTSHRRYSSMTAFDSSFDAVFFTFLPNIFIHYNVVVSWIIIAVFILAFIALLVFLIKTKKIRPKKLIASPLIWVALIGVAALFGLLFSVILAASFSVPFYFMATRFISFTGGFTIIFSVLTIIGSLALMLLTKKIKLNQTEKTLSGLLPILLFLIVSSFALHGATYLFIWPLIFASSGLAADFIKNQKAKKALNITANILLILFTIPVFFTVIYAFLLAMTIGALAIMLPLAVIGLMAVTPAVSTLYREIAEKGEVRTEKECLNL